MIRSLRFPFLIVFMLLGLWGTSPLADSNPDLTGDDVYQITRTFLRSHYSRGQFDDDRSRLMLQMALNQYDPNHLYFLQSDIDEFKAYETQLDDLIEDENIEIAFTIFDRFRQRLGERIVQVNAILDGDIDLDTQESFNRERQDEPYPGDSAHAEALWRTKLKFDLLEQMSSGSTIDEAKKAVRKRLRNLNIRIEQTIHNDIVTSWLNAFTAAFDPHSAYLSPDDLENFNISLRLSLEGIGATLRSEDGYTVVTSIIPGGAADKEGSLKPEDKIVGVGQGDLDELTDVVNQRLADVVKLIRGPRGTTVRLSVLRDEGRIETQQLVTIIRDKIILKDGEAQGRVIESPPDASGRSYRFGVVKLPSFYVDFGARRRNPDDFKSSSRDVKRLIQDFVAQNVDGVILDLRNNGGGGLDEAVSLSGLFLNKGPVVMVKDFRGRLTVLKNPHSQPLWRGPLLVMTNRYSASASEILAGALKDYGRAILVGDRSTFGKGTVQNVITLREGLGAVKTTVAKFYRPGSASTQHRGVVPDVVLPSMNNHLEIGESSLKNALPWDAISKADFKPWQDLSPYLPLIQQRSRERLADSAKFHTVSANVKTFVENRNKRKTVTTGEILSEIRGAGSEDTATADAPVPDATDATDATDSGSKDIYLDESTEILADYIQLARDGLPADVARQNRM